MFGGVTHLSLDLKNRMAIPAKYRDELQNICGSKITITLESPKYLLIYPETNWLIVRDKIQNLETQSHPLVKSYQRLVLGYAETLEMDKNGRVLIPNALKSLVKLDKELVLVGLGNRFELWDKANWDIETANALNVKEDQLANLLNGFSL